MATNSGRLPPRQSAPNLLVASDAHTDRAPRVAHLRAAIAAYTHAPTEAKAREVGAQVRAALDEVAGQDTDARARRSVAVWNTLLPLRPAQVAHCCGAQALEELQAHCHAFFVSFGNALEAGEKVPVTTCTLARRTVDVQVALGARPGAEAHYPLLEVVLLQAIAHACVVAEHRRRQPNYDQAPMVRVQSLPDVGGKAGLATPSARAKQAAARIVLPTLPPLDGKRHLLSVKGQRAAWGHVFSELTADGSAYTISSALARGVFGKFKLGRSLNQVGAPIVAVKEVRTRRKTGYDREGVPKTRAVSTAEAWGEADLTGKLRGLLESRDEDRLALRGRLGIDAMVSGSEPSEVLATSFDQRSGKLYLISTLQVKTAEELMSDPHEGFASDVPAAARRALAASFAAQTFLELHVLHAQAQVAHLDLKLGNTFFNTFGEFKLADFGMVRQLDHKGRLREQVACGTHPAPEMLASFGPLGPPAPVTAAADVYALAVSCLDLLGGEVRAPMVWQRHAQRTGQGGTVDREATAAMLRAVSRYVATLPKDAEQWPRLPRDGRTGIVDFAALPASGEPEVDRFLLRCIRRAPDLSETMLAGLQANPSARPSALQLAEAAAACFAGTRAQEREASAAYMQQHVEAAEAGYGEVITAMDAYENEVYGEHAPAF